jgi:hypothetical protein
MQRNFTDTKISFLLQNRSLMAKAIRGFRSRHNNNTASYGAYGPTWSDVYNKMSAVLIDEEYKLEKAEGS